MANFDALSGQLMQASNALTLEELSLTLRAPSSIIIEMVEFSLFVPTGTGPTNWSFDSLCFKRAKRALSFKNDLELNLPGIALALDLLDQIDELESQLKILQRYADTPFE
jgi:chaperone modulatory protein CbpM